MWLTFRDWPSHNQYFADVNNIKWTSDGLYGVEGADYQPWLAMVERFRVQWGAKMVPLDIQSATHSVQDVLEITRTVF